MSQGLPVNVRQTIFSILKLLRHDKTVLFFFATVFLDFSLTTIGLIVVGPRWENNSLYKTWWQSGQYLTYFAYWFVRGFLWYAIVMYAFARVKGVLSEANYATSSKFLNLSVLYVAIGKLFWGGFGWGITLGCNYLSSIQACNAYLSSNTLVGVLVVIFSPVLWV